MIIVRLKGGLGNQMFQYATGKNLATKYNTELKVFFLNPKGATQRQYELGCFNLQVEFATQKEINLLKYKGPLPFSLHLNKLKEKLFNWESSNVIRQKHFHFDPDLLNSSNNIILDGHWQSEKYFNGIEKIIRKEFSFKNKPEDNNMKLIFLIKDTNSVCIHVRRGDYVTDSCTNRWHGVCSAGYYDKAIQIIRRRLKDPHFFVFSDEPNWAENNIKINAPTTYVAYNTPDKGYEDLRLMENCKNFILSNSSFSWYFRMYH